MTTTQPNWRHLGTISSLFVALLLISNTVASKIIFLGGLALPGATLIFPLTYIFGDILTEVYGFRASRKVIWTAVAAQLLMSAAYWLVGALPAAPFWPNQEAYQVILGFVPRIVFASIVAFFCGEFLNSIVLAKLKVATGGRHLWLRTISSTILGEGIDSIVFGVIAFAGVFAPQALATLIISQYLVKVVIEVVATPLTYLAVSTLKKAEGQEAWDTNLKFNPFRITSAKHSQ
jgi:uncharacterized integral membrane protein (TIGR00697 family)